MKKASYALLAIIPGVTLADDLTTAPETSPPPLAALDYSAKDAIPSSKEAIIPPSSAENPWSLGAGLMWRRIGKTDVSPNLAASQPINNFFSPNPSTGPLGSNANRTYDNGFVNIGAGTPATGLTSNFSIQNDSQVDLAADTLTYTATGGIALDDPLGGSDDDETATAPYIELSYLIPIRDNLSAGFSINISTAGLESSINSSYNRYSVTTTDTYDLNGVIPPLAPYTGSFNGPGPLIDNQPANREFTRTFVDTQNYLFESDTRLYSLAIGGDLRWQPSEKTHIEVSAGAVINYVDWDAQFRSTLINPVNNTLVAFNRASGDSEFLFGLYLQAGAGYQINESWSADAFFRYDWTEDLEGQVGPSTFTTDLSGWSIGTGLTFQF